MHILEYYKIEITYLFGNIGYCIVKLKLIHYPQIASE